MKEQLKAKCLQLTEQILQEYYFRQPGRLFTHLDGEVVWIGAAAGQYVRGADKVRQYILGIVETMPKVYIHSARYEIVADDTSMCVVSGEYIARTGEECEILLEEKQRVTFVWKIRKDGEKEQPVILHIHVSNILHIQEEDEKFPVRAGKQTYKYMKRILENREKDQEILIKDSKGILYKKNLSQVLYIKSNRNYVEIYCKDEKEPIICRRTLSDIEENCPEYFTRAGRSVIVNVRNIACVKEMKVIFKDNSEVEIPLKYARILKNCR